ncbi:MAG: xanthine dehydrogenase family protein molybdopterin-binding subunit [Pseudomonadota bacterium]
MSRKYPKDTQPTVAYPPPKDLIGAALLREEDSRFLRGEAEFGDDLSRPDMLFGVAVRSPVPHARIRSVDIQVALEASGVQAVLTAAELEAAGLGVLSSMNTTPPFDIRNVDGGLLPDGSQPVLAVDRVRYVGECIAFVVAESLTQAMDGAECVQVDYEELPAVTNIDEALAPEATLLWDDLDSNQTLDWAAGDPTTVSQVFAQAEEVVSCTLVNNRINPCFMEPRSALASLEAGTGRMLLEVGCQGVHGLKGTLCGVLGWEPEQLRVVSPDVGGGFGARGAVYPEYVCTVFAAKTLGRPVKWCATRAESFLSDCQSRDHLLRGELALDANGQFLAIRARIDWRHGGYMGPRNAWVMTSFLPPTLGGVYRIAHLMATMRGTFSNTTPQAAFRGIGRLESNYLMERLADIAARKLNIDPVEIRRRNIVSPGEMPWTAAGGGIYNGGRFEENLDKALAAADYDGFPTRREASRERGLFRGIGIGMFVENDGGAPTEFAEVEVLGGGSVNVYVGTQDFGMGHRTMFAQVAASQLDLPYESVRIVYGDTDKVKTGSGSHGSRSARIGGTAVVMGVENVIEKARQLAGEHLEAAASDIGYAEGRFTISGTDRSIGLFQLAGMQEAAGTRLADEAQFEVPGESHSNGCHVCEVEVDPDTGKVSIVKHVMAMDVGVAINPLIVHGQLHGGAAQGLGQAVFEGVEYDPDSGQTLTGSFMDYNIPKADDLPFFTIELNEVRETDNPLGAKGAGEGPTSGSPAALVNAVLDALAPLGVEELQMPLTPFNVWQAISDAPNR